MSEHEDDTQVEDAIAAEMGDEEPDTEPDPEPEPEGEPEPEPEPEPEEPEEPGAHDEMVARDKYADRARKYLAKNMGEVLGEDANNYAECPFCNFFNTPGFLHASPCPPELLGTVYEWTNTTAPDEYLPDGYSRECDKCNGLGEVRTGSKVRGQETLTCIECKGSGWIAVGPERQSPGMYVPNGPQPAYSPPDPDLTPAFVATEIDDLTVAEARARGAIVMPPLAAG